MTMLYNDPKPEKRNGSAFLLIVALLVAAGLLYYFFLKDDNAAEADLTPGATADYDVAIDLFNGLFNVSAEIEVLNASEDSREEIGFDFVPAGLHERSISVFLNNSWETRLSSVTDSEGELFYKLNDNRFFILLRKPLEPGSKKKVSVE
ncbi:hypothetical protein [Planomicrobium sp. CPCC 101079]|uniref:hypothetical protein n=1 Tax=Planomicrobium sp. CPCC 101079 TaxID=2599618 RepID=UPI0011B84E24|nr:hypothetical protein [Planomicrobium sp. CPCC 101079]TWT09316.1 hypothetical protein FQV28_06690 [Planomicrobium sp. CPCC 101079]